MAASPLSPKTQRNHMLPRMWNQPPCMNIEVSGVQIALEPESTHWAWSPSGTTVPSGTWPRRSPGISPKAQSELTRPAVVPRPWRKTHEAAFSAMIVIVATSVRTVGFSSRRGNTRARRSARSARASHPPDRAEHAEREEDPRPAVHGLAHTVEEAPAVAEPVTGVRRRDPRNERNRGSREEGPMRLHRLPPALPTP